MTKRRLDESVEANASKRGEYEDKYRESLSRIEKLEESVTLERQSSEAKLDKMSKIEKLLDSLKQRASEADAMEQELTNLRIELRRIKSGRVTESGDASTQPSTGDSCSICQRLTQQLQRIQACLEDEVRKSCEIQGELNYLRERARTAEVVEAELCFYKVRIIFSTIHIVFPTFYSRALTNHRYSLA